MRLWSHRPILALVCLQGFYHIKFKSKTGSHAARSTHPIYQDFAKTNRLGD